MQCPVCSSEISADAVTCAKCGARRVTLRSPFGVIVGWAGITMTVLMGIMWLFLFALILVGHAVGNFPWRTLFAGTLIAAALLWHSRSTRHAQWKRSDN